MRQEVTSAILFLEKDMIEYEDDVDVRVIYDADEKLTAIAKELGLIPLSAYYQLSFEGDAADLFQEPSDTYESAKEGAVEKKSWYFPAEGLSSICPMIEYLEKNPERIKHGANLLKNLKEFESVLREAEKRNVGWSISIQIEVDSSSDPPRDR